MAPTVLVLVVLVLVLLLPLLLLDVLVLVVVVSFVLIVLLLLALLLLLLLLLLFLLLVRTALMGIVSGWAGWDARRVKIFGFPQLLSPCPARDPWRSPWLGTS